MTKDEVIDKFAEYTAEKLRKDIKFALNSTYNYGKNTPTLSKCVDTLREYCASTSCPLCEFSDKHEGQRCMITGMPQFWDYERK